jgi:hypothetical protein
MKPGFLGIVLAGLVFGACLAILADDKTSTDLATAVEEQLQQLRNAGIPTTFEELNIPEIPDEQNGALLFRQAFELKDILAEKYQDEWQYMPHEGTVPWEEVPAEARKQVTDLVLHDPDFARLYQLIQKASLMKCCFLTKEDYQQGPASISAALMDHLSKLRGCVRILVTKAKLEAENGEIDKALSTILANFRTPKSLSSEPFLLPLIVRIAMDGIVAHNLEEVLNQGQGGMQTCQSLVDQIREERNTSLMQHMLKGEFPFAAAFFSQLREGGQRLSEEQIRTCFEMEEQLRAVFGPGKTDVPTRRELDGVLNTLREEGPEQFWYKEELVFLQMMSKLYSLAGKPYWEVREELNELRNRLENMPDGRGVLTRFMLPPLLRTFDAEARSDAQLGTAELALALRIYKAENRFFPTFLDELVPEVIPELPKDPYTGDDFVYNPRGMTILIYSVGPNLKDDGGTPRELTAWMGDYDIVWKLSYF